MAFKLVRKLESGKVEPRKRGRAPAGSVNGHLSDAGDFVEGDPPKKRGRRGRKPGRPKGSTNKRGPGRPKASANGRGLGEIEAIVRREVQTRLERAKAAAIAAFEKVLG